MSTTYSRLFSILNFASSQPEWDQYNLATSIRQKGLTDKTFTNFKLKLNGVNIDAFMKEKSIISIIDLMVDLDLFKNNGSNITFTPNGQKCINSESNYIMQIRSSVMSLMQSKKAPLSSIIGFINEIMLPDVPNTESIYRKLSDDAKELISLSLFRRLLFLLACAEGVDRVWTVYYRGI